MSKKKPGEYPIPFRDGNLCHYPSWPTEPNEWKENFSFTAELTFQGYRRGRSAAYMQLKALATGPVYPMLLTHFADVVHGYKLLRGKVSATWTFCKCGQNYGLCLAPTP